MPDRAPNNVGEVAARLVGEVLMHAARQLEEILPPEARIHLIRAQRELLLAAVAALEHHQPPEPPAPVKRGTGRVRKISLD